MKDSQGLDVTTDSPQAINAINQFTEQLLSYGSNPEVILEGLKVDPNSAILNAHAAALHLFAESADAPLQADPYLQTAKKFLATATEREKLYVAAVDAWAQGDADRAVAYHEEIAQKFPRDVVSVQLGQYHYFNLGDSQGLLHLIEKVLPANDDNHYIYGMLAFGLEQCHRLSEAEAVGRKATEMHRHDPWAHHAVAHVLETQGRIEEGIAWMEDLSDTWEDIGTFYTHNWWHTALYYLDREDIPRALELYDQHIWGRAAKEFSQCQIDAISFLLRLELRGIDVDTRWQEIGSYLIGRLHEHVLGYLDLHYIYALARAGQDELVDEMLNSILTHAEIAKPYICKTWAEVAVPAVRGLIAHARGYWLTTVAELGAALPRLHEMGGSHAQRDVFEQVYLDALLRSADFQRARVLLEKRAAARGNIPSIQRGLALTYKQLGLADKSHRAASRAERG